MLNQDSGSVGGLFLSAIMFGVSIAYTSSQWIQMNNYAFDSYKSEKITNNMVDFADF